MREYGNKTPYLNTGTNLAASSFLIQYKDAIIITGLLANVAGSIYIARANIKYRSILEKVEKKSQSNGG